MAKLPPFMTKKPGDKKEMPAGKGGKPNPFAKGGAKAPPFKKK